jgi:hypothetical protein
MRLTLVSAQRSKSYRCQHNDHGNLITVEEVSKGAKAVNTRSRSLPSHHDHPPPQPQPGTESLLMTNPFSDKGSPQRKVRRYTPHK